MPNEDVIEEANGQRRTSKKTKPVVMEMIEEPEVFGWANLENYNSLLPGQTSLKFLPIAIFFFLEGNFLL